MRSRISTLSVFGRRIKGRYPRMREQWKRGLFSVNNKGLVHFSYDRYLENQIRNNIDFDGTPIILQFKNKSE